jgi:hypothetical protein
MATKRVQKSRLLFCLGMRALQNASLGLQKSQVIFRSLKTLTQSQTRPGAQEVQKKPETVLRCRKSQLKV